LVQQTKTTKKGLVVYIIPNNQVDEHTIFAPTNLRGGLSSELFDDKNAKRSVDVSGECPNRDSAVQKVEIHFRHNYEQVLIFIRLVYGEDVKSYATSLVTFPWIQDLRRFEEGREPTAQIFFMHAKKLGYTGEKLRELIFNALLST